jgi:hypothetical protein
MIGGQGSRRQRPALGCSAIDDDDDDDDNDEELGRKTSLHVPKANLQTQPRNITEFTIWNKTFISSCLHENTSVA